MLPPLISYITFNRLGLTIKNLEAILNSEDDFELHIIDNGSTDGTWKYLQTLQDRRILSKAQVSLNFGKTYSSNVNMLKRRPDQYFISLDNDVYIETKDWVSQFMRVFEAFPEVGMLGVQGDTTAANQMPPVIPKYKEDISYLELDNSVPDVDRNYIPGHCICLRPELIKEIGYFSEENCFGEIELSNRINNYTAFKTGFVPSISIKMPQISPCSTCPYNAACTLNKNTETCFTIYNKTNTSESFKEKFRWKFDETLTDLKSGARPVYCACINDLESTTKHIYNKEWAQENFTYFFS